MILSGKTIGELALSTGITSDSLFAIEQSGFTFHIPYSGLSTGGGTYEEVTYNELYSLYTGGTLVPGGYYLITDFQTCYDQPDFDTDGNPITIGNYKTGNTEPLLVFATSGNTLSPQAYSTIHPLDKITYDITWNLTEVTNSPAKGRITERIDEFNNRADYDFRNVLFKRYRGYFSEVYLSGKVNLDGSTGQVTGTNTQFSLDFLVGDVIGIYYGAYNLALSCFKYYEITQINSDTDMVVSGRTLQSAFNVYYSRGNTFFNIVSPFQCNITGGTNDDVAEYLTFDAPNYNTYLGNNSNYNTFILSNNVFIDGDYNNNTFGGNVVGNTFDDDMDSNLIGSDFQYNIITNDFQRNIIGSYFQRNIIQCDMEGNIITYNFEYNMLGDDDGNDFDYNTISSNFLGNFLTFSNNDFRNNIIGDNFFNNVIDSGFRNNKIQGFFTNNLIINNSFNDNTIEIAFSDNNIPVSFVENKIGTDFSTNLIYSQFNRNTILNVVYNNVFGDVNNFGLYSFEDNEIGNQFYSNIIYRNFNKNQIGNNFTNNLIDEVSFFSNNVIGNDFSSNNVYANFLDNEIGNNFSTNTLGDSGNIGTYSFQKNKVYSDFGNNQLTGTTQFNEFGFSFNNNTNNSTNSLQKNKFTNGVSAENFSTATHVFGYYDCNIFQRPDGNFRLSYFDNSDVLIVTGITS